MKAKQMMDKDFIYASKDDSIVDISIRMEEQKKFTVPILDDSMKLVLVSKPVIQTKNVHYQLHKYQQNQRF